MRERKKERDAIMAENATQAPPTPSGPQPDSNDQGKLPYTSPEEHYHISETEKDRINLISWVREHGDDIAYQVSSPANSSTSALPLPEQDFIPRLKNHLLTRLLGLEYDGGETEFTGAERNNVVISSIYRHKTLRVNYTSYDMRRNQDYLNPQAEPADIMLISQEDESEKDRNVYWYGRIIDIFHADIQHINPESRSAKSLKMDFLWMRWLGRPLSRSYHSGWKARRIPRLAFLQPEDDLPMHGFIDPSLVVRRVHLIPAFVYGRVTGTSEPSAAHQPEENDKRDWNVYYINMHVVFFFFLNSVSEPHL